MTVTRQTNYSKSRADPLVGLNGICNAKRKNTYKRCTKEAGWATDHPGFGACKLHGGGTPSSALSASRQMAVVMGAPMSVTPHEGLLYCISVTRGEVEYCNMMLREIKESDILQRPITITETHEDKVGGGGDKMTVMAGPEDLHIWIRIRQEAIDRLARYCKMALAADVDARLIKVAEGMATVLVPVLQGILEDLQLSKEQQERAPKVLSKHLLTLEAGTVNSTAEEIPSVES